MLPDVSKAPRVVVALEIFGFLVEKRGLFVLPKFVICPISIDV